MWRPVVRMSGLSSTTTSRARPSTGTDVLVCPPGSLLRASRSSGSGRWTRRETTITGTGKHVPVHMSLLLFLLGEVLTASPGRYTNTGRAAYLPVTMQRHVPAVLRASWPTWTRRTVAVVCTRRVLLVTYAPRAVFTSLVGRPRMLGILAGTDLKYSCSGMYKAGFSGVSALRAVLPEVYRKIGFWEMAFFFFFGPLYLEVTCSGVQGCFFPGDDFRNGFSIQHSSWFKQRIHVRHQFTRLLRRILRFPT